jgi:peptidoglycan hydrolase CwlO-like protein
MLQSLVNKELFDSKAAQQNYIIKLNQEQVGLQEKIDKLKQQIADKDKVID